ncbi:CrcB-like protein-domain-containing protein [Talaromyces proteolyticus]|uniref:CrcB-like protein-domain-containing protein n=1 Tax=Talaromyces proteolyticus TaxID=1131652 RepID=A0AAD4PXR2_9EURO|nr:CrcB-like protein-domain-containing protein [Talaromyces proteolyticus]KAH8696679.1 CrcB-like protein-domain-containing protein [Talaromyces proteolyticus]
MLNRSLQMPQETVNETAEKVDEEHAVAPLSEVIAQRPVDPPTDAQRQPDGAPLYQPDRDRDKRQGDESLPLAELVSEPPATREPTTTRREQLPSQARPPSELLPLSSFATKLYTISYLIFFAIFGTLARLGLQALTFYPGAPIVTGVLWANFGGCLLMGFFIEDRNLFREEWGHPPRTGTQSSDQGGWLKKHKDVKKSIPLYIGLTTGFCGSFTSFSSFMRDAFLALSNDLPDPSSGSRLDRNRGDSFMAVVAVLTLTVCLSISALYLGAHLALALDPLIPIVPFHFTRNILDRVVVLLGWGCWVGAVFMSIWPPKNAWRGEVVFAIVFAPLGCLLRFYLSLILNPRIAYFPLGTFAVNIIGTGILGMCYDLQHVAGIGAESRTGWAVSPSGTNRSLFGGEDPLSSILVSCQVLQGVMDGFCGCATTVSTWVAELTSLGRRRFAYQYGGASMAVGFGLLVVLMGSVRWGRGFDTPICT